MTRTLIAQVEIWMNEEDGTYRMQYVRPGAAGVRLLESTVMAETIPAGLRALAAEMERRGRKAFGL